MNFKLYVCINTYIKTKQVLKDIIKLYVLRGVLFCFVLI